MNGPRCSRLPGGSQALNKRRICLPNKFSDGSTVEAGELPNDGQAPLKVKSPPRTINWMEIEITKVGPQTKNAGFSEIAVFNKEPGK